MAYIDDDMITYTYEGGHWIWDDEENGLKFIQDQMPKPKPIVDDDPKGFIGFIKFLDDMNVYQQNKFDRKYKRKILNGEPDIIILQDIKDVVLYTAPYKLLNEDIISLFHSACYDRFIRSLIVYMQYFLQLHEVMQFRKMDHKYKLRSYASDAIELKWAHNLSEMRVVVAKEYFHLIYVDEKYIRKQTELINVEKKFMEIFLRMSIQIVWICFKRLNFDLIDVEIGRLFRSQKFNLPFNKPKNVEFKLDTYAAYVLHGNYHEIENKKKINGSNHLRESNKLRIISPLAHELLKFKGDHKVLGINVIGFQSADLRYTFLENLFCAPEELFFDLNINLGILGKPRNAFDAFLKVIKKPGGITRSNPSSNSSPGTKSTKSIDSSFPIALMEIPTDHAKIKISLDIKPKYEARKPSKLYKEKWLKWYESIPTV